MAVREIVVVPHGALSQEAEEIENIDDHVRNLARDMVETMYKAPGIGLAANQVGEAIKLIVVDVDYAYGDPKEKKKNPIIIINPEIGLCEGGDTFEEGCLSVPEFNVDITRPSCIQLTGVDLDGNPLKIEAEGLLARALQHEVDHLRGTTILDHASVLKRNIYRRRLKKQARKDR
ncbi:MAG: peptide deformylase [Desulfomonilaceae bacterium]|nr:peptide deformylase [Desulfomonilaceae bacterium]